MYLLNTSRRLKLSLLSCNCRSRDVVAAPYVSLSLSSSCAIRLSSLIEVLSSSRANFSASEAFWRRTWISSSRRCSSVTALFSISALKSVNSFTLLAKARCLRLGEAILGIVNHVVFPFEKSTFLALTYWPLSQWSAEKSARSRAVSLAAPKPASHSPSIFHKSI